MALYRKIWTRAGQISFWQSPVILGFLIFDVFFFPGKKCHPLYEILWESNNKRKSHNVLKEEKGKRKINF